MNRAESASRAREKKGELDDAVGAIADEIDAFPFGANLPGELPRDPCDDVTTLDDVPIVEWEGVLYLAA